MTNQSISLVQKHVTETLGKACIQALHAQKRWLDYAALGGIFAAFFALVFCLSTLPFGPLWLLCFILQGFVLMIAVLIYHDLFVHRHVLPRRIAYPIGLLLTIPVHMSPTRYRYGHLAHHRHLGGDGDSELFKIDIDTPPRRLLYATFLGVKLASAGRFARVKRTTNPPVISADMHEARRRIRTEYRLINAVLIGALGLGVLWPQAVFLGYLLPLFVVTPVANTIRTVLEHSEFEPQNPFYLGCFYRTGPLSRLLFFWDSGDCHLVHHVFPGIPFYRITRALQLMRPIFLAQGVIERRSLLERLWVWFTKGHPYRTSRGLAAAARGQV